MIDDDNVWLDAKSGDSIYAVLGQQAAAPTIQLPAKCPECGNMTLHLFFHRYYDNRGGGWAWCSSCHGFGHGGSNVPKWWINSPDISMDMLTAVPIKLDQVHDVVDRHWNTLLDSMATTDSDIFRRSTLMTDGSEQV